MRKILIASALALSLSSVAALAKKAPEMTGLELQQIQSRDVEATKEVTFSAVMSVLQDAGYRIGSADKDTGLITGTASTSGKVTYNLFWGFGKSKKTPIVSAYIESRSPTVTRIRLNFVMAKVRSTVYSSGSQDEEPITDPAAYQQAFEKINQAVFVRQAMDAPTPVVTMAAPAPAPAIVAPSTTAAIPNPIVTPTTTTPTISTPSSVSTEKPAEAPVKSATTTPST